MEKQQARKENENAVMFCHEGSFFTFYDVDALIVNHLCGYKIIASGSRPKAGVPLSNTSIFERLEKEGISYFVFKKDDGIKKEYTAKNNRYAEIGAKLVEELQATGKNIEQYFDKSLTPKHTGRNSSLKMPKIIPKVSDNGNNAEDTLAVKQAYSVAESKKFKAEEELKKLEERDVDWERVTKIPEQANDLITITKVKKLGAYIIAITEKSPAKFRGTFVNRMQNFGLITLENLIRANFIHMNSEHNKQSREQLQQDAVINLKMLGYIAMVSESAGCILPKQYKQIAIQVGECINLTVAWMKSDNERWSKK